MAQFVGFGDGSDGALTISSNTTDAPIDSACTGTSGTTALSATNASFVAGQKILIHQSRGSGAGAWEINEIASYVAGTITTSSNLSNTYISGAQVLVLAELTDFTVNAGIVLSVKSWNGTVGGILAKLVLGTATIDGTLFANGTLGVRSTSTTSPTTGSGFRGGAGVKSYGGGLTVGFQGEGTGGASAQTTGANGNGGGGSTSTGFSAGPGGGGGNATSGGAATGPGPGASGSSSGSSDLITMVFGGGGGGAANNSPDGGTYCASGGSGGGIIMLFANTIDNNGLITASGGHGVGSASSGDSNVQRGPSGAGAGGSILIKSRNADLGSGLIIANGGTGGYSYDGPSYGGNGSVGIIRFEGCNLSGSSTPAASESEGGHSYCSIQGSIF